MAIQPYKHECGDGSKVIIEACGPMGEMIGERSRSLISRLGSELMRLIHQEYAYNKDGAAEDRAANKRDILALFPPGEMIYVKEIPNQYSQDYVNSPWFQVWTRVGMIELGWRSRVISIDYKATDLPDAAKAEILFANETSTRSDKCIHAWTNEKAKDYIYRILMFPASLGLMQQHGTPEALKQMEESNGP